MQKQHVDAVHHFQQINFDWNIVAQQYVDVYRKVVTVIPAKAGIC